MAKVNAFKALLDDETGTQHRVYLPVDYSCAMRVPSCTLLLLFVCSVFLIFHDPRQATSILLSMRGLTACSNPSGGGGGGGGGGGPQNKMRRVAFDCPVCTFEFNTDEKLNEHVLQQHPTKTVSVVSLCLLDGSLVSAPPCGAQASSSGAAATVSKLDGSGGAAEQDQMADRFLQVSSLDIAGLAKKGFGEKLLYVREEVSDLFDFLNSSACTKLVEGPPGSGKSSATWAWACQEAKTASVLWAHMRKTGGAVVALLSGETVQVVGLLQIKKLILIIERTTAGIVVSWTASLAAPKADF
jgi:hypothetical protein